MIVIDPRALDAKGWAQRMVPSLSAFGYVPIIHRDEQWREWGNVVVAIPQIAALHPPMPAMFKDWMPWAQEFNRSIALLSQ